MFMVAANIRVISLGRRKSGSVLAWGLGDRLAIHREKQTCYEKLQKGLGRGQILWINLD
jgi:hypothetical protein